MRNWMHFAINSSIPKILNSSIPNINQLFRKKFSAYLDKNSEIKAFIKRSEESAKNQLLNKIFDSKDNYKFLNEKVLEYLKNHPVTQSADTNVFDPNDNLEYFHENFLKYLNTNKKFLDHLRLIIDSHPTVDGIYNKADELENRVLALELVQCIKVDRKQKKV